MTDFGKRSGLLYVDRGDPSDWDFTETTLTSDGSWHDIDFSSVIPSGAIMAHLIAAIRDSTISRYIQFQEKGNTNNINVISIFNFTANIYTYLTGFVLLDSSQKCEYRLSNISFNDIRLSVKGWFI